MLVETAASFGAKRSALFEGTGVSAEMLEQPDTRISYNDFGALVGNALRLTGNSGLGIDCGMRTHITHMGMLGVALASSTTVAGALGALMRNLPTVSPTFEFNLAERSGSGVLQMRTLIPVAPERFVIEMMLAALNTQGRLLYGRALPIRSVHLSYAKPRHAGRYVRDFYDVPFTFGAAVNEIRFDPQLLTCKLNHADAGTARLAESLHRKLANGSAVPGGYAAQVRALLLNGDGDGDGDSDGEGYPVPDADAYNDDDGVGRGECLGLEQVARRLQTTPRTLRRWLREEGTSFLQVKDERRHERALEWIADRTLSCEQIAGRLGFSDVRGFRRAFKRWTGKSPSEVRNHLGRRRAEVMPI